MQREKTYSTKPEQNQNIHNQYAFLFVQNMYHCPTGNLESYLTLGEMTDLLQMHREKYFKKPYLTLGEMTELLQMHREKIYIYKKDKRIIFSLCIKYQHNFLTPPHKNWVVG